MHPSNLSILCLDLSVSGSRQPGRSMADQKGTKHTGLPDRFLRTGGQQSLM